MCAIEFKNRTNKKAIFCFRVTIKSESCRYALSFRFSFTSGPSGRSNERGSEKERNENVTLDDVRNRRLIGSSESQNARPGPTRPGPGSRVATSIPKGMEAGLGASRCSWNGFGVPPRPLVIHEAPLEIERHNEALPGIVGLSIVWQLLQRIHSFIRFSPFSRLRFPATGARSRNVTGESFSTALSPRYRLFHMMRNNRRDEILYK